MVSARLARSLPSTPPAHRTCLRLLQVEETKAIVRLIPIMLTLIVYNAICEHAVLSAALRRGLV